MKSYVFCYCHLTLKLVQFLTKIAGVISFLNHQKSDPQLPEPVSPEAIKKLFSGPLQKSFTSSKSTDLNIGDLVLIKEGSFANCEGRITYLDEKKVILEQRPEKLSGRDSYTFAYFKLTPLNPVGPKGILNPVTFFLIGQ